MTVLFRSEVNKRCLRGLQWEYDILVPWQADLLIARLDAAFDGGLRHYQEDWGSFLVRRLVLKFQFEIRIGERSDGLTLIHRVNVDLPQRQANQAKLERQLQALLEGSPQTQAS